MNAASPLPAVPSWWQRRIVDPIARQLTQGTTPARLALALAVGGAIAVNPFLGTTTAGCLAAGALLRLNQPVLQIANLLAAPLLGAALHFALRPLLHALGRRLSPSTR